MRDTYYAAAEYLAWVDAITTEATEPRVYDDWSL